MGIIKRSVIILSIITALFILFPTIKASAIGCTNSRFVIEDEVSGQSIGLIYSESPVMSEKEFCIQGDFLGKRYQYLYRCNKKEGKFEFIQKYKEFQEGCRWGVIH